MSSYYNSTTHGRIPLSKMGKYLMQRLRNAIVAAICVGDYNAHRQEIATARGELARYVSKLEGNNPMYAPETIHSVADLSDTNPFQALRDLTLKVATSHGRSAVVALLARYSAASLNALELRYVTQYTTDLNELATKPTPANAAFRSAQARVNGASTRDSHDRALFEAGREFERSES